MKKIPLDTPDNSQFYGIDDDQPWDFGVHPMFRTHFCQSEEHHLPLDNQEQSKIEGPEFDQTSFAIFFKTTWDVLRSY